MKFKVRVGSRESALAVVQARIVMDAIAAKYLDIEPELVTMKTSGDKDLSVIFSQSPGGLKGMFVKELEQALLDRRVDLVVHSMKDVPMEQNPLIPIVAVSAREHPFDALVLGHGEGGPIGCSSARRKIQLSRLMPEYEVRPVRGNIITRIEKLDRGEYGMLVLAAAGLRRMGMTRRIHKIFTPHEMVPAAGQGAMACQGRSGDDYGYLDAVHCPVSCACVTAERAFSAALGGGCTSPVAAYAHMEGETLKLTGLYIDEGCEIFRRGHICGLPSEAVSMGEELAGRLRSDG